MTNIDVQSLKVGARGLPDTEQKFFKALLRLCRHNPDFRWQFADCPPYDALIIGHEEQPDLSAQKDPEWILKLVTDVHQEAFNQNILARPIRADKIERWLLMIDAKISAQKAEEPDSTAATVFYPEKYYKLKRWPSAALLKSNPVRIRLATLLSRKAFSAVELGRTSGLEQNICQDFMQALAEKNLLLEDRSITNTLTSQKKENAKHKPLLKGLISGLRKTLFAQNNE